METFLGRRLYAARVRAGAGVFVGGCTACVYVVFRLGGPKENRTAEEGDQKEEGGEHAPSAWLNMQRETRCKCWCE